jgi:PAS domain S-box-containing protein
MNGTTALTRYGIAIAAAALSLFSRLALLPILGSDYVYIFCFSAVLLSAWLGGLGPGLVATIISGAGALYVVIPPVMSFKNLRTVDIAGFLLFIAIGIAVSHVTASWRETTAKLRESARIYRTIGEATNYGVWICDASGRNTYASESFLNLVGITQQECAEFGWGKVLHPDDRERTIAAWKECVRTEGKWDIEHRFLGMDGKYYHVLARGAPVRNEQGKILCWAGINLDITSLRQAEQEKAQLYETLKRNTEELSRSNRELEQFAFAASHDLQEPLRTINIYTQLLLRKLKPVMTPDVEEYAIYIHRGVERLHNLITDLLAYSRVVHHSEELPDTSGNLRSALEQALAGLQPMIAESGANIVADSLPDLPCDESQLAQVFQNLVSNAIKYRHPGRTLRVEICTAAGSEAVTISVRDNGIGFSPEHAGQIFGLFKRLHRNEYPGTGLGLAICKRIVERYGGQIWAEAEPDQGACFYFTLRVAAPSNAKQESTGSESRTSYS